MPERFIRASHLRSLLPAVLLLAPALAVATILVGALTGAERPAGSDGGVAPAQAATKSGGRETLRACILHPETRSEHLATLVAEVVVAARVLAAAG